MHFLASVVLLVCIAVPISALRASSVELIGINVPNEQIINDFKLSTYNATGGHQVIAPIAALNLLINAMAYMPDQNAVVVTSVNSLSGPVFITVVGLNGTVINQWVSPDYLIIDIAYDTVTRQLFVAGFDFRLSDQGEGNVLFEVSLNNGSLHKIVALPGYTDGTANSAYSSTAHVLYMVMDGGTSLVAVNTQTGKVLSKAKGPAGHMQVIVHDDATATLYAWVMNEKHLALNSINVTTGQPIKTFESVASLHGNGGVAAINPRTQIMYASMLQAQKAYWVVTDLISGNYTVSASPLQGVAVGLAVL